MLGADDNYMLRRYCPPTSNSALVICPNEQTRTAVIENKNVFEVLMDAVRVCSLGQITNALFEVGGQYRRNM